MVYHASLAGGRWYQLSLFEQMGNIASEVGRMLRWQTRDRHRFELAFWRALELIDLTRSDARWRTPSKLKELSRFRELLVDAASGGHTYASDLVALERYLYPFALGARLKK